MIVDFASETALDIFNGENTRMARKIPTEIWPVAQRKFDMLDSAHALRDLKAPPANRLEALRGKMDGLYSIRVNDRFRIVFEFHDGNAHSVDIVDYH
jgi:proteic killer suppression protein